MKFVTILGARITLPAAIVAALGVVIGLSMILIHHALLLPSLMLVATFFLTAYNMNCAVVGQCEVWAWLLFALFMVMFITSGGLSFWAYKNLDTEKLMNPPNIFKQVKDIAKNVTKMAPK